MTRVWRKRRALKWVGLVLSILMIGLWGFSVLITSQYFHPSGQWRIDIVVGRIDFLGSDYPHHGVTGWKCGRNYRFWRDVRWGMTWTDFARRKLGFAMPEGSWKRRGISHFPIWLLVVATGFPTAILWWRDRRPKAGLCNVCKYDLTGNVSGNCPECGTALEKASKTNTPTSTDGA